MSEIWKSLITMAAGQLAAMADAKNVLVEAMTKAGLGQEQLGDQGLTPEQMEAVEDAIIALGKAGLAKGISTV